MFVLGCKDEQKFRDCSWKATLSFQCLLCRIMSPKMFNEELSAVLVVVVVVVVPSTTDYAVTGIRHNYTLNFNTNCTDSI